jgi:hypothetical protein
MPTEPVPLCLNTTLLPSGQEKISPWFLDTDLSTGSLYSKTVPFIYPSNDYITIILHILELDLRGGPTPVLLLQYQCSRSRNENSNFDRIVSKIVSKELKH